MNDVTRLSIETLVLMRQRIDQRIDAELFRISNGLYPNPDTINELTDILNGSAYAEIIRGFKDAC